MLHKHCSYPCTANGTRTQQSGVVLIVALALLVVIGFSSAFILRNALFSDTSSNNLNTNQAANHAAEVALRYCEDMVLRPPAGIQIIPLPATSPPIAWRDEDNWAAGSQGVFTAPANLLQNTASSGGTLTYAQLPQCMIEQLQLVPNSGDAYSGKPFAFQITARGYSPDGISQVVLQSTIRIRECIANITNMDC
jgi:type IV pilus assembly protein PilX